MTANDTFRNTNLFFTLMNIPGPLGANYTKIIKNWFDSYPESKYRYIEDSDIIRYSYPLATIEREYPGISTIAIVMNPWIRIVKMWEFSKKDPQKLIDLGVDLSSFENCILSFKNVNPARYLQSSWLKYATENNSTSTVPFILREEYIAEDFSKVQHYFENFAPLDVPTIEIIDYRPYFNDELNEIVNEIFKEDIELLDYKF